MNVGATPHSRRSGLRDFRVQPPPVAGCGEIGKPRQVEPSLDLEGHVIVKPRIDVDEELTASAFNEFRVENAVITGKLEEISQATIDCRIDFGVLENDPRT